MGTVLDEELLKEVKLIAARENRRISEVIEEALREYLRRRSQAKRVVKRTRGAIPVSPESVREIMAEEDFLGE